MREKTGALAVAVAAVLAITTAGVSAHPGHKAPNPRPTSKQSSSAAVQHVLLISVDGLHQSDLEWYVQNHPSSTLAKLANGGAEYTKAHTPVPSDSFPGMVGQVTGGDPRVTGVYYDDTFNHAVDASSDQSNGAPCSTLAPGAEVTFFEQLDLDFNTNLTIDAGYGLSGLPGHPFTNDGIMLLPPHPTSTLIDPNELPRDPSTCDPIYPHSYLKVNTVFNVIHDSSHGALRTAWADKHPAYEILNGPEGNGIDDLFTPEINANAFKPDGTAWTANGKPVDYTGDNAATMQYDDYKVQAVLNEIAGLDHSGSQHVGVPALFGMNFQTVSTAEKLPTSDGLAGGYVLGPKGPTPGPLVQRALGYINDRLGMMMTALGNSGLTATTAIILSAKHGQSPLDPSQLVRIDDGPIMSAVNSAWASVHPDWEAANNNEPLILGGTDDDAIMWWLNDRSQEAAQFAAKYLISHTAQGNALDCNSSGCDTTRYHDVTVQHSGLRKVYAGNDAASYFHVPAGDSRVPDVWGVVQVGVIYTGGHKKIAEHGGANPGDRDVPLIVYAPGAVQPRIDNSNVETTQIAPTILALLGLDPTQLDAVQSEHTKVLPHIG
jgi:hypothetical protein